MPSSSQQTQRHHVTAVLVAHDGQTWLPRTLEALAAQTRQPHAVIAVDTGSADGTYAMLAEALGNSKVIRAERSTTFGAAIALAARTIDAIAHEADEEQAADWLWLLHDDSAPAPDALQRLLERADTAREAVVIGPKVRDWDHPAYLVEVGLTMDGAGHRHTGLERHELDQGQHDGAVDVLAVGSAGMLVRRDTWDALGGFDPHLTMFRDDVDFGWRANLSGRRVVVAPRAVVFHAQAGATGRRPLDVTSVPPRRLDRTHAMFTVLANASLVGLIVGLPRLALVTAVRATLFLATRRPAAARDEILAYGGLLVRGPSLLTSRLRRRRTRTVGRRAIRHLQPRRGSRLRSYVEHIVEWLGGQAGLDEPGAALGRPDLDKTDDDAPDSVSSQLIRRAITAPAFLLFVALTALSLAAFRHLLGLHGSLVGGRLLPMPPGSADVWRAYLADWHSVGVGVGAPSPPYVGLLAALSSLCLGKPWLAVDVLLLGAVPLAGATAYRAAKRLTTSSRLRVWAGLAYAVSPPVLGAVTAGRLDAVLGLVLLPVAAGSVVRALRPGAELRRTWVAALAVTIAVAASPILYAIVLALVVVLLVGGVSGAVVRQWRLPLAASVRSLLLAAVPLLVLAPWSVAALRHPVLAVRGAGPVVADAGLGSPRVFDLLLGLPGGSYQPPMFLYLPILLAAVAALGSERRRHFVASVWCAALGSLVVAVAVSRLTLRASEDGTPWRAWAGVPVGLTLALLLAAAARSAQGTRARFRRESFSWRQPAIAFIVIGAAAAPLAAVGWLATHSAGPVVRGAQSAVPAYVRSALGGPLGTRALVLAPQGDRIDYTVLEGATHTQFDADVAIPGARQGQLTSLVRELTSGPSDAAGHLTAQAIGYVVLLKPDARIAAALDAQPGVSRVPKDDAVSVWTLTPVPTRLSLLSPGDATLAQASSLPQPGRLAPLALDSTRGLAQTIPAGPAGRLLVLAESADKGWQASLDDEELPRATAFGTQQAFVVPAAAGTLVVRYEAPSAGVGRWVALGALTVLLVLAAPPVRLRDDVPGEPDDFAEDTFVTEPQAQGADEASLAPAAASDPLEVVS